MKNQAGRAVKNLGIYRIRLGVSSEKNIDVLKKHRFLLDFGEKFSTFCGLKEEHSGGGGDVQAINISI
jgi:hypothetical protein